MPPKECSICKQKYYSNSDDSTCGCCSNETPILTVACGKNLVSSTNTACIICEKLTPQAYSNVRAMCYDCFIKTQ